MQPGAMKSFKATPEAAGLDLYSIEQTHLNPSDTKVLPTGIGIKLTLKHLGLIKSLSSLTIKGIQVLGGVIDNDYQGEIKVLLQNGRDHLVLIAAPDQIAQLFISPYLHLELSIGMPLALQTLRGDKTFGSSNLTCPGAKVWFKLPYMNKL